MKLNPMATRHSIVENYVKCSGSTKKCYKTNWQLSICCFYYCDFSRLSIRILVQAIDTRIVSEFYFLKNLIFGKSHICEVLTRCHRNSYEDH